jgi:hypothetical protein
MLAPASFANRLPPSLSPIPPSLQYPPASSRRLATPCSPASSWQPAKRPNIGSRLVMCFFAGSGPLRSVAPQPAPAAPSRWNGAHFVACERQATLALVGDLPLPHLRPQFSTCARANARALIRNRVMVNTSLAKYSSLPDLQQQAVNTVPAKLSKSVRSGFDQPPYSCFGVGGAVAVGLKRWRDRAKTGGRRRRTDGLLLPLGHLRAPRLPRCFV